MQAAFQQRQAGAVFNVGTLVYPVTKAQYTANSVALPPQLFSHADQQVQWQTSIPDRPPTTGWGGRCADLLDTYNPKNSGNDVLSMCISLAGSNTFEVGGTTTNTRFRAAASSRSTPRWAQRRADRAHDDHEQHPGHRRGAAEHADLQNYALAFEHALASGTGLTTRSPASPLSAYWKTFPTTVTVPNGGNPSRPACSSR